MKSKEIVIRQMKRSARIMIACSLALAALMTLIMIYEITVRETDNWTVPFCILSGVFILLGLFGLVNGIGVLINPLKDKLFRDNPYLFEMAEELFATVRYEDKDIIISDRVFAPKKRVYFVTPYSEVFWVYVSKTTTNFIPTGKELVFVNARNRFSINILFKKKDWAENVMNTLLTVCPNMRAGYLPENMSYADEMTKQWKAQNSRSVKK